MVPPDVFPAMIDTPPTPPVRQEALSVQQAARILGVHEETVRRWIKAGHVVAVRIGPKLLRIPRAEIARLRSRQLSSTHDHI